ncbi:MAG: DUF4856 domain-containing protein [Bacteroidota bacterium]
MNTFSIFPRKIYSPIILVSLIAVLGLSGCKPEPPAPELEVPSSYVFTRDGGLTVRFGDVLEQLNMLEEMSAYMAETERLNGDIEGDRLTAMFRNGIGADFQETYNKSLLSKTHPDASDMLQLWMEEMGEASVWQREAKEGQSGFLSETYGTGAIANSEHLGYLVNENGVVYQQIIEIGLMGAVFFHQAMENHLTKGNMGTTGNDERVETFFYTQMEHEFDAAFGYFGVPLDYPLGSEFTRFWGRMMDELSVGSNSGRFAFSSLSTDMMTSFLRGRAAISQQMYSIRDEEIINIADQWNLVIGGTAADLLEQSKSTKNVKPYEKHHALSGAIACLMSLTYHEGISSKAAPSVDLSKIDEALQMIGLETNLWQITDEEIEGVIQLIIGAYPAGTFG